jgi:sec-independent protein translocase protein TatA
MRVGPFGIWEILIILVVVLLLFGPKRLPELAQSVGQSVREFRKGIKDLKNDIEENIDEKRRETVGPSKAVTPEDSQADKV